MNSSMESELQTLSERFDKRASHASTRLSARSLLAYAAPGGAMTFLWMPTMSILPGLYAKHFGLSLTKIAFVLFISRLLDGLTDPLTGYAADRHRVSGGSYKTWVVAGGVGLAVAAYFLFSPPHEVSQEYYLVWSLVFYVSWSLIDIPHAAWGATLADSYHERSRVYGFRSVAVFFGLLTFFAMPFLPILSSKEFTPATMMWTVRIGIAFMAGSLLTMIWAPAGTTDVKGSIRDSPLTILHDIYSNKPLWIFLSGYLIGGVGYGMWFGLVFVYLDSLLQLGEHISAILLIGNVVAICSMPMWLHLARRVGKARAWMAGTTLFVLLLAGCYSISPDSPWWLSLILVGGVYVSFACQSMSTQAILGDITDYGVLKFRRNRAATYFSLLTLTYKVTSGVGSGLALKIAGEFGFDPASISQTSEAVTGVHLAFIILPALLALTSLSLIRMTPLSEHRHSVIRRRIGQRAN
jgi:glycoside/pentoside/hexuronide:cation symporter, GPH family